MLFSQKLSNFIRIALIILLYPLIYVVILAILILIAPIFLLRKTIAQVAHCCKPELGKILTTYGSLIGAELVEPKPHGQSLYNTIVGFTEVDGPILDIDQARRDFIENVIEAKSPSGGVLYPELQQFCYQWMGFVFFKWDPLFNIQNHVKFYTQKYSKLGVQDSYDEEQVQRILTDLLNQPFHPHRSPWEYLILNNYKPKNRVSPDKASSHCMVFFRLHHSLVDGFSVMQLLAKLYRMNGKCEPNVLEFKPRSRCSIIFHFFEKVKFFLKLLALGPFHLVEYVTRGADKANDLHVAEDKLTKFSRIRWSPSISIDYLKNIAQEHKVKISSLLISAVAGGLREFMLEQHMSLPNVFKLGLILARKAHPDKLRNHLSPVAMYLPLRKTTDSRSRLRSVDAAFRRLQDPHFMYPYMLHLVILILGTLPASVQRRFKAMRISMGLSSWPGFNKECSWMDRRVLDNGFISGTGKGNLGLSLTSMSYNKQLKIQLMTDEKLLTAAEHELLLQRIVENLNSYASFTALV